MTRTKDTEEKKCKQLVGEALKGKVADIRKLWDLWTKDSEASDPDLGNWNEYGLGFDYVAPGTFNDQRRGYFRYQLSYGGPSEEFRFFTDENLEPVRIEFWYLDWYDGAKKILSGDNESLLLEIFHDLKDCGTVEHVMNKAVRS